jgi:hypothetical protein
MGSKANNSRNYLDRAPALCPQGAWNIRASADRNISPRAFVRGSIFSPSRSYASDIAKSYFPLD